MHRLGNRVEDVVKFTEPSRRALLKNLCYGGAALATGLMNYPQYAAATTTNPIVQTTSGKVRGATIGGVNVFKGIPYGTSPAGESRFVAPRKAESWSGVRDALRYGPLARQKLPEEVQEARESGPSRYEQVLGGVWYTTGSPPESEDCLVLNIWSRDLGTDTRLPVMVWLHPGSFTVGSGNAPCTEGAALAGKRDVVVVSLNHRLNVFGFLSLAAVGGKRYATSGNVGMLDIVEALRWVQENIAHFGGDPDNVTIFGQSGGAGKVSVMLAMPAAKGLFHKALVMGDSFPRAVTEDEATKTTEELLGKLKIGPGNLRDLHRIPANDLLLAIKSIQDGRFAPVVDGVVLPQHPFLEGNPSCSADVPMMIGYNKDEALYYSLNAVPPMAQSEADIRPMLAKWHEYHRYTNDQAGRWIAVYRFLHPEASPQAILYGILNRFWLDNIFLQAEAKSAAGRAPVYMYEFTWEAPGFDGQYKSCHCFEIPFAFSNVDAAPQLYGEHPDPRRYKLAEAMSRSWAAFAHQGAPGHSGLPTWEPYSASRRATMLFNYECRLADDPDREDRIRFEEFRAERFANLRYGPR